MAIQKINKLQLKIIKFLKYFRPLFHHHTAASRFKEQVLMIKYLIHSPIKPYNLPQAICNSLQDMEAYPEDLARFLLLLTWLRKLDLYLLVFLKDLQVKGMNQPVLRVLPIYFIVIFLAL